MQVSIAIIFLMLFSITAGTVQYVPTRNYEPLRDVHQLIYNGEYEAALKIIKNEVRRNPGNDEAQNLLHKVEEELETARILEDIKKKRVEFEKYKSLGLSQIEQGNFVHAKVNLENAIKLDNDSDVRQGLDFIDRFQKSEKFFEDGNYELAHTLLNSALKLKPKNKKGFKFKERILIKRSNFLLENAQKANKDKNWRKAISTTRKILSIDERDPLIINNQIISETQRILHVAKRQNYKNIAIKIGLVGLVLFIFIVAFFSIKWLYNSKFKFWREYKVAKKRMERNIKKKRMDGCELTKTKHEELRGALIAHTVKNKLYEQFYKDTINTAESKGNTSNNTLLYARNIINNSYKEIKKLKLSSKKKSELLDQILNNVSNTIQNEDTLH